jgi:hypothetical protein
VNGFGINYGQIHTFTYTCGELVNALKGQDAGLDEKKTIPKRILKDVAMQVKSESSQLQDPSCNGDLAMNLGTKMPWTHKS